MLTERADDGRFGTFHFMEGFDPGEWRKTPPTRGRPGRLGGKRAPFLVPNVEMLRTDGPNPSRAPPTRRTSTR